MIQTLIILKPGRFVIALFESPRTVILSFLKIKSPGVPQSAKADRDVAVKRRPLQMLELLHGGLVAGSDHERGRSKQAEALFAKRQPPPRGQAVDIKTLQDVVLGVEALGGPNLRHAAWISAQRILIPPLMDDHRTLKLEQVRKSHHSETPREASHEGNPRLQASGSAQCDRTSPFGTRSGTHEKSQREL